MTNLTHGTDCAAAHQGSEYLTLVFSPLSTPLRSRWRNNGLSADFLGDYVITFLPATGGMGNHQHAHIRHAVAYIANELLENAMKYHEQDDDTPIRIHLELSRDTITVSTTNGLGTDQARAYQGFVERLVRSNAGELLLQQLEASAEDTHASCLGLLTMINDYGAQLDWRFDPHQLEHGVMTVTTSAVLSFTREVGAAS